MLRRFFVLLLLFTPGIALADDVKLFMAEERGCYYCAQWNKEISHIYPKTNEGKAAPLVRYDLRDDAPQVELVRKVTYSPTFILAKGGREVGRIEGYPGEDAFWWLLTKIFQDAGIAPGQSSQSQFAPG